MLSRMRPPQGRRGARSHQPTRGLAGDKLQAQRSAGLACKHVRLEGSAALRKVVSQSGRRIESRCETSSPMMLEG